MYPRPANLINSGNTDTDETASNRSHDDHMETVLLYADWIRKQKLAAP